VFKPGFVNYKKRCTRLACAAASDKVYQLLAHGRWFSPGTPASSTTKSGRHDIEFTKTLRKVCNWNFLFYCSNIAKSENAMLWRMLSRLETCIVYCCIWTVALAKSIVPRKTWRKLWHSILWFCNIRAVKKKISITYLAKRLRELSSTKTGSYPHEFLCRTNCSACADYQPCLGGRVAQWVRSLDLTTINK
jgi:hypothetical protein